MGIRAEHLALAPTGQGVRTTVALVEHLGDVCIGYLKLDGVNELLHVKFPSRRLDNLAKGMALNITAQADDVMAFNAHGQRISV
ncbi:TOBE domain-containing protein [Limnohabitans sp.]|uniref:TOBE domain-containing protein n=1 Tax=Limnohabitans sp. TaxID=1907725 RepID=UPI00286F8F1E|nr:TOBE domain-containing protein [Limnohabitans sp.]